MTPYATQENFLEDITARFDAALKETENPTCTCGCKSSMHIDGCEQCFNGDCGCKEFEESTQEAEHIIKNLRELGYDEVAGEFEKKI
jgi:hypothetical protein